MSGDFGAIDFKSITYGYFQRYHFTETLYIVASQQVYHIHAKTSLLKEPYRLNLTNVIFSQNLAISPFSSIENLGKEEHLKGAWMFQLTRNHLFHVLTNHTEYMMDITKEPKLLTKNHKLHEEYTIVHDQAENATVWGYMFSKGTNV